MTDQALLREQLRKHLERERLDDTEYQRLAGLFHQADPSSTSRRHWHLPVALAASVVLMVSVALTAVLMVSPSGNGNVAPRIAEEVLTNHLKLYKAEVTADSIDALRQSLDRLDFVPVASRLLERAGLELIGGRYCTLQGRIATQILMVDERGNRVTHFQATFDPERFGHLPQLEAGEKPVVMTRGGAEIRVWVESGLVMALASCAASAGCPEVTLND